MCHVDRAGNVVEFCRLAKSIIEFESKYAEFNDIEGVRRCQKGLAEHLDESWKITIECEKVV